MSDEGVIKIDDLAALLGTGEELKLLDVLPAKVFLRRHLPGALNACVYEVGFLEEVKAAGIEATDTVIVYATDDHTLAAEDATLKLERAGYTNVRELEGGIEGWVSEGHPVEGTGESAPEEPPPPPREELVVDTAKSRLRWIGRNLAGRHEGEVGIASGALLLEHGQLTGGRVEIDMTAITCTDIADGPMNRVLIDHLESDDFFDVVRHPSAILEIGDVEAVGNALPGLPNLRCTGSLTLKGVTNPVRLMLTSGRTGTGEWVAQSNFDLDRTRYGVNYGSGKLYDFLGMHLVNDLITLEFVIFAG